MAYGLAGILLAIIWGVPVQAWTASNLTLVSAGSEDAWYNYDFHSQTVSASNVDWPIRYLFASNAEVDAVKNRVDGCGGDPSLSPCLGRSGSKKYFRGRDGAWYWDSDGGKKAGYSCQTDYHIRVYARPDTDQNYSPVLGWYILGSVHRDEERLWPWSECESKYYSTEWDQWWWDQRMGSIPDWTVHSNISNWLNYESRRWADGTHFVESDGYTSYVTVPYP